VLSSTIGSLIAPHFIDGENHENHINGIESFCKQARRHLRKFNGIPKASFELYLKEYGWRPNTVEVEHQLITLRQRVKEKLEHLSRKAPRLR